jgi:hypothetical protein
MDNLRHDHDIPHAACASAQLAAPHTGPRPSLGGASRAARSESAQKHRNAGLHAPALRRPVHRRGHPHGARPNRGHRRRGHGHRLSAGLPLRVFDDPGRSAPARRAARHRARTVLDIGDGAQLCLDRTAAARRAGRQCARLSRCRQRRAPGQRRGSDHRHESGAAAVHGAAALQFARQHRPQASAGRPRPGVVAAGRVLEDLLATLPRGRRVGADPRLHAEPRLLCDPCADRVAPAVVDRPAPGPAHHPVARLRRCRRARNPGARHHPHPGRLGTSRTKENR